MNTDTATDIAPDVAQRMVDAYNGHLASSGDGVPAGCTYRVVGLQDVLRTYDIGDLEPPIRSALERGESVVQWATDSDGGMWLMADAKTEEAFFADVRRCKHWPGPVACIEDIFTTSVLDCYAASAAFEVLALSHGWLVTEGGRYVEAIRPCTNAPACDNGHYEIRLGVRISDHSRQASTSRPANAIEIHINLAPHHGAGTELHWADDWQSAARKLRTATLTSEGDISYSDAQTGAASRSLLPPPR